MRRNISLAKRSWRFWPALPGMALVAILAGPAAAQWQTVGTGVEYAEFTAPGPNNLFVTRMDRSNPEVIIESSMAHGRITAGLETVRNQASRYDQAINYWGESWGQRNKVVAAINGDFWDQAWTGVPLLGQIHSGWYAKRFTNVTGGSGFGWKHNRTPFIGECITHWPWKQLIHYPHNSATQEFQGLNRERGSNELIVYTSQYNNTTMTDNSGVEVLVEMSIPAGILPTPNSSQGIVRQIRQNQGSTLIPFDHVVLSATGSRASQLLANVTVGATVGISHEITSFYTDCETPMPLDWTKTYASVGGNWIILKNGVVPHIDNPGAHIVNPRTAIAYNDSYIFFVVCDGRGDSVGMTMPQLGNFCKDVLGATWAINLDGGGSSTMVVNGQVKNTPSDGWERAVANGLMMVVVEPRIQSTSFAAGEGVRTTSSANVRLGPGTNYPIITTLDPNTTGTILAHQLAGVRAKNFNWWRCQFGGTTGWIAESLLASTGTDPPAITQHPVDQRVNWGNDAAFSVTASGSAPLSYRWQRNQVNLSDGGPYAGATTANLTVSNVSSEVLGDYRCVVNNSVGTATSNPAQLTLGIPGDFDGDGDVDIEDFAHFQRCLSGANIAQTNPDCFDARLDGDLDVDGDDFAIFFRCMSGPNIPGDPYCAQ